MNKWAYKLQYGDITITNPIRMEGSISYGANTNMQANFTLYNLSASSRNQIYYQPANILMESKFVKVSLSVAKDGQSFVELFSGVVQEAYSTEKGSQVGIATHISAFVTDIAWANSSHIFAKGTSKKEAVKTILNDMPNITLGSIGNLDGNFLTDTTCDGNSFEQLQKITGGNCFVDNNKLYIVNANECVYTGIHEISNDTILLGTPSYKGGFYNIQSIFFPEARNQQLIKLKSHLFPDFDGEYRVVGYTHNFIFDDGDSGQKTTDFSMVRIDNMPNADIVTTTGTSKTNANDYQTLSKDNGKYKIENEKVTSVNTDGGADVESVYKYIQLNNGKIPNKQITPNISWREMLGFYRNTDSQRKSECTKEVLSNVASLAQRLQKFRDTYFNTSTINITCGWRSNLANTQAGGESGSLHKSGKAVDFYFGSLNVNSQWSKILAYWNGGRGKYTTFIHVDLGSKSRVWYN